MFLQGLASSADAIGQMAILVLVGYTAVRRKWISSSTLGDLTGFLIDLVIPCAFLLSMIRSFSPEMLREGGLLSALSAAWILFSWLLGKTIFRLYHGGSRSGDRTVTAMMMISNSLYLPLPVILAVTPAELHDRAVICISMISLPSILIMWTLGVKLLGGARTAEPRERLRRVLNPPLVSFLAGMLLSAVPGLRESALDQPGGIPVLTTVFQAMDYMALLLSPLAMIILGGLIASGVSGKRPVMRYLVPLAAVRLLLVPALVFLLLRTGITELTALPATALLLVAAAPPATNHALIARRYEGEWELVASLQLATHLLALLTLPLWLSLALTM